jgi:hypothetical protein
MLSHSELIEEYIRLDRLDGGITPQERGTMLNTLVGNLFRTNEIAAEVGPRGSGEIDVAFNIRSQRFVLEAKWESSPISTEPVAKLQKRVRQRLMGTTGLLLSMSGFSGPALRELKDGERLSVLLLDRSHLECMLSWIMNPQELIEAAVDSASYRGNGYTSVHDLLRLYDPPGLPTHLDQVTADDPELVVTSLVSDVPMGRLGVAVSEADVPLLTTGDAGVHRIHGSPDDAELVIPLHGLHGGVHSRDAAYVFHRLGGIGQYGDGSVHAVGGGWSRTTEIFRHPDGSEWIVQCNPPQLLRVPDRLLDQTPGIDIEYPSDMLRDATWINDTTLLLVGGSGLRVVEPGGVATEIECPSPNLAGVASLGPDRFLVAGGDVDLHIVDTKARTSNRLARLDLRGSVYYLARLEGSPNVYIASHQRSGQQGAALLRLNHPAWGP